jgi:phosphohistidine swiveling domain-containing protein
MKKCPWYEFQKTSGFCPLDTEIATLGYIRGENDVFSWRFKNMFFYYRDGVDHSFRGLRDFNKLKNILKKSFNKDFIKDVGVSLKYSADDLYEITQKTFKNKSSLRKNIEEFVMGYQTLTAILQIPLFCQTFRVSKNQKALINFGLYRDYAARKISQAEHLYRAKLKKILKHPKALFLTLAELRQYLDKKILPKDLNTRETWALLVINKKAKIFWNKKADQIYHEEILKYKKVLHVSELKGQSVYKGKIMGKVFVALNERQFKKIPKGSILVCSMTRYHIVPFLKKISALVTEKGGITCHAAIIARELKVPTVIGTEHATDVFKTGDLVEVDAERGIVRLVKKVK